MILSRFQSAYIIEEEEETLFDDESANVQCIT